MGKVFHENGIVLRSMRYRESSMILDVLTEARGMESYVIGGVRKQKTRLHGGLLQIMNQISFVAYESTKANLQRMKEFKLSRVYDDLPYQMPKSALGQFAIEVIHKSIHKYDERSPLYAYLKSFLDHLDGTNESLKNLGIQYLIDLSRLLGFGIQQRNEVGHTYFDLQEGWFAKDFYSEWRSLDKKQSNYLVDFLRSDWLTCREIDITVEERRIFLKKLLRYFEIHVEHFREINSLNVFVSLWT